MLSAHDVKRSMAQIRMKTAHFKSRQRKKKLSHKGYYEHMSRQFISFIIIHSFFKSQLVKRLIERWCLLGGTMGSNIFWSLIWILTHYFTTDLSIFQMRGIFIDKLVAQGQWLGLNTLVMISAFALASTAVRGCWRHTDFRFTK